MKIGILTILMTALLFMPFCVLFAQTGDQTADESASAIENTTVQDTVAQDYSIGGILERAGKTRFFIYGVLALGIFFIIFQFIILTLDRKRSMGLRKSDLEKMPVESIRKRLETEPDSSVNSALLMLYRVYSSSRDISALNEEINSFLGGMKSRFSTFTNWMNFLSDAAGALGLLGTVIGMFTTFFGADTGFDNRKILDGMGIALITTLLGIIVSLILNLLTVLVTNYHNRNLEYVMEKSDEFRIIAARSQRRDEVAP